MERNDPPRWLERARDHLKHGDLEHFTMDMLHIQLEDVLRDSCFYQSAGSDITPIVAFKDTIYSYVLCDLELYAPMRGIGDPFFGTLVKVKCRLLDQGFSEIQKFNVGKRFFGVEKLQHSFVTNNEISFWLKDEKLYCILYLVWDNTEAYRNLYQKNNITPKALCTIAAYGAITGEDRRFRPEYELCHHLPFEGYEEVSKKVEYFGDFGGRREKDEKMGLDRIKKFAHRILSGTYRRGDLVCRLCTMAGKSDCQHMELYTVYEELGALIDSLPEYSESALREATKNAWELKIYKRKD